MSIGGIRPPTGMAQSFVPKPKRPPPAMPADGVPPSSDMLIFLNGCAKGEMGDVRWFLQYYPRYIECHCDGKTGLMYAAENGYGAVVDTLIEHGAVINASDNKGMTALHLAAGQGQEYTVRQLLKHGAKIKCSISGGTPFHSAARHGHDAALRELIATHPDAVDLQDREGFTPLPFAIQSDSAKSVRLLLDAGARLDVRFQGWTLSEYAGRRAQPEIIVMLGNEPARREAAISATIDAGISGGMKVRGAFTLVKKKAAANSDQPEPKAAAPERTPMPQTQIFP